MSDEDLDVGTVDTEVSQPTQAETEAKQFGWVPLEEFKGNEAEWRDADAFLQRGKEINGFLRKDLDKIKEADKLKAQEIAELKAAIKDFADYHKETEARAYARAKEDLRAARADAIAQGDGDAVNEIDDKLEELKEAQKKEPKKDIKTGKTEAQLNSEYREWIADNDWYGRDEKLTILAESIGDSIRKHADKTGVPLEGAEFFEAVTKKIKELEPEKFSNQARNTATVSSSSDGRSVPNKGKKTYNDLPQDAKNACDRYVKQGLLTREKYVSDYDWS